MTAPPQSAEVPLVEVRSIDWVPESERHGRLWHQAPLWFLGNFQYFTIAIGFIGPSMGLTLGWTVLAAAIGLAIGTIVMALHATQGPRLGLPQMIQSRAQFGYRGVAVPLIAALFTYFAFNVSNEVLLPDGLNGAFGWSRQLIVVLVAVAAGALAIFGHDWVHRAFRLLLALSLLPMIAVSVGVLLGDAGGHAAQGHAGLTAAGFMTVLAASASYNITYAVYVSDYTRYLPVNTSPRAAIASVFFGAAGSALWLIALGAWLSVALGATDGLSGLLSAGNHTLPYLGSIAVTLSAISLVCVTGMNTYGGILVILTAIDSVRPITPTLRVRVITGVLLTVAWFAVGEALLSSSSAISTLAMALTLMLYLLVPWTAVNLTDFFIVRRGHYAIRDILLPGGTYGQWAWRGLLAYAIGLACEIPFMLLPGPGPLTYVSPGASALNGVDIAWLIGLAVAACAFYAFSKVGKNTTAATLHETAAVHVAAEDGRLTP